MQFRILGSLQATSGSAVADLGPPKQRALLAILLMHVGEIVAVDRLVELLWGDAPPRTALHSIQIYVSDLRKALGGLSNDDVIVTRQPGYLLAADPGTIDAWQFEHLVRDGVDALGGGDAEMGRTQLRAAIGLWRGPALTDFAYEDFAQPYIRRLNDLHLDAIEVLAAAELDTGRGAESVAMLEAAVREDPLRERSRELLMLALYRSGRHADALRTFAALQTQLADELGIDPSPKIRGLYDRILLHDPALRPGQDGSEADRPSRNPYKGLRPFTETDAPDFFGRDALVAEVESRLASGARFVALVGPSGSGKSSVVSAGVTPGLRRGDIARSAEWRFLQMMPGPDPLAEADALLGDRKLAASGGRSPVLLFIDQFELVFSVTEEGPRSRFLAAIAEAMSTPDTDLRVVVTLRADFYDRPLLYPDFAAVFTPSVINVLPMTPEEIERAVVEPATRVGVQVEPALLAELVADTADRPGSLPLLQFALTELFDQRSGAILTRAVYTELGGLRGLLSRRAEDLYLGLDANGKAAAMQVFLRLVRSVGSAPESRRRIALAELTDLGIDPVVLSGVLAAFGNHRLLTFDRDPVSDEATVEVAHEALLVEWERLAEWIDRHRAILRRHGALTLATEEWESSGRSVDYLLTGGRLEEFEGWRDGGVLQLSGQERAFLDASVELRAASQAAEAARVETQRRYQRRMRGRLVGLGLAVALLAGGLSYALVVAVTSAPIRVTLLQPGSEVSGSTLASGFDEAVADLGLTGTRITVDDALDQAVFEHQWLSDLRSLSDEEPAPDVIVLFASYSPQDARPIIAEHPDVDYLIFNTVTPMLMSNVGDMVFRDWDGAFLAGVAAALKTQTGTVGVIGAVDGPPTWESHAGFVAGVEAADPSVEVLQRYLASAGDTTGFNMTNEAKDSAIEMYGEGGADIIFGAGGNSGLGIFEAATELSDTTGRSLWAIGIGDDQYETVTKRAGALDARQWRTHILTSMVQRYDGAVYDMLGQVTDGSFSPGLHELGLDTGSVGLSYSGGFIDDIRPQIEDYQAEIINGTILVPCIPDDRLDVMADFAAHEGVTLQDVVDLMCPGTLPAGR